jgi:hypothetical protein
MRFVAGSNGMVLFVVMKMPNVGVALALICVVTLRPGGAKQAAVVGVVSHTTRLSGKFTPPVSTVAVIAPLLPTLAVATEKTPAPVLGSTVAIPSWVMVTANATTSGTGIAEADRSRVLSPVMTVA